MPLNTNLVGGHYVAKRSRAPVQDGKREADVAALFGLTLGSSRIDVDATDEFGNPYELKTTSKGSVSTARDLGPQHIEKWSGRYWIVSRGENLVTGFVFLRHFFLAPEHMNGWYRHILSRLDSDIQLSKKCLSILESHLPPIEHNRVEYLLSRGKLLNDPNIPWRYIEENGIEIKGNHAETLRELIKQFPLTRMH